MTPRYCTTLLKHRLAQPWAPTLNTPEQGGCGAKRTERGQQTALPGLRLGGKGSCHGRKGENGAELQGGHRAGGESKQRKARVGTDPSELSGTNRLRLLLAKGDGRGLSPSAPGVTPSLLPVLSGRHVLLTGCRAIDAVCLCPGGFLVMEDASINTRESSKSLEIKKSGGFGLI